MSDTYFNRAKCNGNVIGVSGSKYLALQLWHFKCNYIYHNLSGFTTWRVISFTIPVIEQTVALRNMIGYRCLIAHCFSTIEIQMFTEYSIFYFPTFLMSSWKRYVYMTVFYQLPLRQDPGGPHVGPMWATWTLLSGISLLPIIAIGSDTVLLPHNSSHRLCTQVIRKWIRLANVWKQMWLLKNEYNRPYIHVYYTYDSPPHKHQYGHKVGPY